jgi:hypothetical protein
MKESYGEGVATHTGPESCAVAREGGGEALTGGRAGQYERAALFVSLSTVTGQQ